MAASWLPPASDNDVRAAHRFSSKHRDAVLASDRCACFHCLQSFAPAQIVEWVDGGTTALCPRCGIDAVLPSTAPYALTPEFLRRMRAVWFSVAED